MLLPQLDVLLAVSAVLALAFAFVGAPLWLWTLATFAGLWLGGAPLLAIYIALPVALVMNVPPVRRYLVSLPIFVIVKKLGILPKISETERTALKAGNVWIESEFFKGKPNLNRIMQQPYPELTAEERAFLDGPVEKLCAMVSDWDVSRKRALPDAAWEHIKRERFWGMIIPKERT